MGKVYDVIVLGAGPGGLSAGLYAGRARLSVAIIEKAADGGKIAITDEIENYPGQEVEGESGPSLIERMTKQCEKFGCERIKDTIESVELKGDVKKVKCQKGEYEAKTIVIATGCYPRPIGCEGEKEYQGKGVSYCATCDANFFEDFDVYVVGGGDAAVEEAMYLTKFARNVTVIHRRNELRAAKSIQEKTNESTTIKANEEDGMFGLFGFIGRIPNTDFLKDSGLTMDDKGYIPTDQDMKTNIPGVFAAGDVRVKTLRQVVTAAGDGAVAATMCDKYINGTIPEFSDPAKQS